MPSTPTIQVAGPTTISISLDGGAYTILGYSDNDNLPSVAFTDHQHEIRTVLRGAVAEEVVTQGTSARIALALVKWDEDILVNLLTEQRVAAGTSTVGSRLVQGARTFALKIAGATGSKIYIFNMCYILSDGVNDSQWGNRERVLTLNIAAIPDGSNILYTYAVPA